MLSDATMAYGERIMTALLGVDALYRSESGDEDGLAAGGPLGGEDDIATDVRIGGVSTRC